MDSEILHYSDMENSDDEELEDTTWMDLLEKEEQDYKSFYKENVDVIKIFYTYVDNNNNIYYVKKDNLFVEENKINKNELIYILKKNKNNNNKNHKLISILQYNIDLGSASLHTSVMTGASFTGTNVRAGRMYA